MKILLALPVLALTSAAFLAQPAPAEAKGCIKGAIVGGVAGHFAGHGKLGAAAGCVIGHHKAAKSEQNTNQNQPNPQTANTQNH